MSRSRQESKEDLLGVNAILKLKDEQKAAAKDAANEKAAAIEKVITDVRKILQEYQLAFDFKLKEVQNNNELSGNQINEKIQELTLKKDKQISSELKNDCLMKAKKCLTELLGKKDITLDDLNQTVKSLKEIYELSAKIPHTGKLNVLKGKLQSFSVRKNLGLFKELVVESETTKFLKDCYKKLYDLKDALSRLENSPPRFKL